MLFLTAACACVPRATLSTSEALAAASSHIPYVEAEHECEFVSAHTVTRHEYPGRELTIWIGMNGEQCDAALAALNQRIAHLDVGYIGVPAPSSNSDATTQAFAISKPVYDQVVAFNSGEITLAELVTAITADQLSFEDCVRSVSAWQLLVPDIYQRALLACIERFPEDAVRDSRR